MNITMLGNSRSGKTNYIVSLFKLLDMCDTRYNISLADTDDCVKQFLRDNNCLYPDNIAINGKRKEAGFCPSSDKTSFFNFTLTCNRKPFLEISSFDYPGGFTNDIPNPKDFKRNTKDDLGVDAEGIINILSCTDIAFVFLDSTILNRNLDDSKKCITDLGLDNIVKSLLWAASQKVRADGRIDVSLILTKTDLITTDIKALENYAQELFFEEIDKQNRFTYNKDDINCIRLLGTFGVTVVGKNKTYVNSNGEECIKQNAVLEPENVLSAFFTTILKYTDRCEYYLDNESGRENKNAFKNAVEYFSYFVAYFTLTASSLASKALHFAGSCWMTGLTFLKRRKIKNFITAIKLSDHQIRQIIDRKL